MPKAAAAITPFRARRPKSVPDERWLSAKQIARLTGFHPATVRRSLMPQMNCFVIGDKSLRVRESDFLSWRERQEAQRI